MTSEATRSVTGSLASEGGALPCASPVGMTASPSGRALVPASLSAPLGSWEECRTSGTCGPAGRSSLLGAALASCLASRLLRLSGTAGLMLYRQAWRRKATPSGRLYWAHIASAPRTSGSACGSSRVGWPTPRARNYKDGASSESTGPARVTAHGQMRTGCSAKMKSGGRLSAEHSRWLMGYPIGWDDCVPMETPSSRR